MFWSGRSWLTGREEGSTTGSWRDLEADLAGGVKQVIGINPPGGMRTKSSLEGRTIFKECSKRLSVSSPGHRGPTGSARLT